jgi:flagellum-specific ATP synthase
MPSATWLETIRATHPAVPFGRVTDVVGLTVHAQGPRARVGELCYIEGPDGDVPAEVVGFRQQETRLMPLGPLAGLRPGTRVRAAGHALAVPTGPAVLGRLMDGRGRHRDGGPAIVGRPRLVAGPLRSPLERAPVERALWTGIRLWDALFTLGEGQRVGIFAGSGVGKTTLLRMLVHAGGGGRPGGRARARGGRVLGEPGFGAAPHRGGGRHLG